MNKPVLKVKRTDDAKQFELIKVAKYGDVGYDLPAIFPYKDEFKDKSARDKYIEKWHYEGVPMEVMERSMRESLIIQPQSRGVIPTGISLEIPDNYWAAIEARSSTSKQMLICPKGVIDQGYRGELFAVLLNVGNKPVEIFHGDRYVQLIMQRRYDMEIVEVDELSPSERGDTGFGSTEQSAKIVQNG